MNTQSIEKASAGAIRKALESNNLISLGGNQNGLDFTNYAEDATKTQITCDLCNSSYSKLRGAVKLCAECTANGGRLAKRLFEHLKQNRKVIRLQKCFACNGCFAPMKFSVYFGICRKCFAERNKPKMTRGNFAEQVARNVRRVLGGAR